MNKPASQTAVNTTVGTAVGSVTAPNLAGSTAPESRASTDAPAYRLSREATAMQRSMMRELIAVTARPGIISFAGGLPAPELLPVAAWAECTRRCLDEDGPLALQYGPPYAPLQAAIAELMAARGHAVAADQVFITSGCQQGLHIAGRLLMDPDSTALVDRFVFPGVRQAFGGVDRELRELPSDVERGLDLAALARAIALPPSPRAMVVVPDFHNPLGRSLDLPTRERLVSLARQHGTAIIEDDPYGLLRFEGDPAPMLVSLAPERTLYLGSFSKLVAPALRIGWLIAPPGLVDKLRVLKESVDLETSALIQRSLARFLGSGQLDAHLAVVRKTYRQRRDLMLAALEAHFPPGSRWTRPDGGMFIWVELPGGCDTLALLPEMVEAGVAYIPGAAFTSGPAPDSMRLNFSNAAPDQIERGIRILGQALAERIHHS
jgi:2-aminoadipate transaminase